MDIKTLCQGSHKTARKHGFWEEENNPLIMPTKIALIVTELGEALEAHRVVNHEQMREELADTLVRLADLLAWLYPGKAFDRFIEALEAKMAYNETRPYKHGKRY